MEKAYAHAAAIKLKKARVFVQHYNIAFNETPQTQMGCAEATGCRLEKSFMPLIEIDALLVKQIIEIEERPRTRLRHLKREPVFLFQSSYMVENRISMKKDPLRCIGRIASAT